jgi:ribosome recycling factor
MSDENIKEAQSKMEKAIVALQKEFSQIRTGRATTTLLDGIKVDCYGQQIPVNQVASIGVPESKLLVIQPWDKSLIGAIEKAILKSDLGLNPINDGHLIRLPIPLLTEERRKELVKLVRKFGEESKIVVRNIRRDLNEKLKKLEKDKVIPEDEMYHLQDESQKITDESIKKIDDLVQKKEVEIMQV